MIDAGQFDTSALSLISCDVRAASLCRHFLRQNDQGSLVPYVNPTTTLQVLDTLNHLIVQSPWNSRVFLSDHGGPTYDDEIWNRLLSALRAHLETINHELGHHVNLFSRLLALSSVDVIAKSTHILPHYIAVLSALCQSVIKQKSSTSVNGAGANAASSGHNNSNADSPTRAATVTQAVTSAVSLAANDKPSADNSVSKDQENTIPMPAVNIQSLQRLIEIQTSDALVSDAFKSGLNVLTALGSLQENSEVIASVLTQLIAKHANSLRNDLAILREEIRSHVNEQRAASGLADTEHQTAPHLEEEEDAEPDVEVAAPENTQLATNSTVATASIAKPTLHLPSFALFSKAGCSQKNLLHSIKTALALDQILKTSLNEEEVVELHDSNGALIPVSAGTEALAASKVASEISSDSTQAVTAKRPVVSVNLQRLWMDLHQVLSELVSLGKNKVSASMLKESIEALLYCHKNFKAADRSKPSLVHQNSMPLSPSDITTEDSATIAQSLHSSFASFIEKHKTALNDLIRKIPNALVTDPYSLLVNFPHVLDFRIKEDYFRQSLKRQNQQQRYQRISIRVTR